MSKHIVEELPARKHAPAAAAAAAKKDEKGKGATEESSEKRIRQAVYDIRYRARREEMDLRQAFSQYMSHSSLNPAERTAVKAKLFGKGGGVSEQYAFESVDWAVDTVANAMFKVFVEGVQKEEVIELPYEQQLAEEQERKYKVRVTDVKNNRSYVRYATREKITQLRGRGLKVEMTEHGEPYEGEKRRGESTARALGGGGKKKLDPVGKEDKDVDNDGDHDKSDRYLLKRRKAIGSAIAMRKEGLDPVGQEDADIDNDGDNDKTDKYLHKRRKAIGKAIATRNEEFIADAAGDSANPNSNVNKIDVMKGKNVVKVFPDDSSNPEASKRIIQAGTELEGELIAEKAMSKAQQRFMGMVYAAKKGEKPASPEVAKAAEGMTKKEAKKFAKTKHKGLPEKVAEAADCGCDDKGSDKEKERDTRGDYAKTNLIKNKLRAMGAKNPIVMVASEETVEEGMGLSVGASRLGAAILSNPRTPYEQGARNLQRNLTDPVGFAIKGAIKSAANTLGTGTNDKMMQKRQPQTPLQRQVAARTQQVINQSYEPDGDQLDELNRLEREQGKESGGSSDPAYRMVKKSIRKMEGTPKGQQKKVPGKKPPAAGEYGGPRSPAQKVAMRRAAAQRSQDMQSSRFD
jgi:hypothetical protein